MIKGFWILPAALVLAFIVVATGCTHKSDNAHAEHQAKEVMHG
jgi:hypothetical protein